MNLKLNTGDKAPDFLLPDKDNKEIALKDFRGKWVILYFYPKDNTPGCTTEAVDFSKNVNEFKKLDAEIIGISPDSTKSHYNFCQKYNLEIKLLSDISKETLKKYGVWQLKKLYGKESYGVVRSTFLINPEGIIDYIWTNVKVDGHIEEVKSKLIELKKK